MSQSLMPEDVHTSDEIRFFDFLFFQVRPAWRFRTQDQRDGDLREFLAAIDGFGKPIEIRPYSTLGLKKDCDFLLWLVSLDLETLQEFVGLLYKTELGKHLALNYSYLALTRPSQYVGKHAHPPADTDDSSDKVDFKYLFVYPFTKTHEWYQLPLEERGKMMSQHVGIGHEYPSVKVFTSYSFGLDDPEFVVVFESDSPDDFQKLVMRLRESAVRPYTECDTPIFTCVKRPFEATLRLLG